MMVLNTGIAFPSEIEKMMYNSIWGDTIRKMFRKTTINVNLPRENKIQYKL